MTDYTKLVEALRCCDEYALCNDCPIFETCDGDVDKAMAIAADAIEALQAEVKRLQDKLCDWCAVCPKERREPEDCEMLSETPVMYGPSCEKTEVQDADK